LGKRTGQEKNDLKTMTAYAATLAAGMALGPMAANAASITFGAGPGPISYNGLGGALSSGFMTPGLPSGMIASLVLGQDTPRNAGERRACDGCGLEFSTGENLIDPLPLGPGMSGEFKWNGGGFLEIFDATETLLTGTFAEPVTATLVTFTVPSSAYGDLFVNGLLEGVMIDEDLAAFYGVPNEGTAEIEMQGSGRFTQGGPGIGGLNTRVTVTFSPVPVPAALPFMLTALAGLGLIRLRRMHAP
jgi:hypothetical protein